MFEMCHDEPMRAAEFETTVSPGGQIALPPEVVSEIPAGEQLRVVVMWDRLDEDWSAWRAASHERLESAYCPEDAIYEKLIDDPAIR